MHPPAEAFRRFTSLLLVRFVVLPAATIAVTLPAARAADDRRQAVSFVADDGFRLTGDLYWPRSRDGAAVPVVMLLHMYRGDRAAWQPLVGPLQEAGVAVFAFDLRGHGDSATTESRERVVQRDPALFQEMQRDVRGAYAYLATLPDIDRSRFAIVGASVGASVALQYAVKDRSVDAIVALSPGLNYLGIDSTGDIRQLTGRKILLIASHAESDAPKTLATHGHAVETEILRDCKGHGTELLLESPALVGRIVEALRSGVGQPAEHLLYGSINRDVYHEPDSGWVREIGPSNLRHYSSPAEARARGLREARSRGPGDRKRDDARRERRP